MGDGVIHMIFAPSNDHDSTFFYVQATTPLKDGQNPAKTTGESVSVTVNGTPLTMTKSKDRSTEDGCQAYWTLNRFKPGDNVEVTASIPGKKTVSSSTIVPPAFPEHKWNYHIEGDTGSADRQVCIDLEYENLPGCSGRYGLAVLTEMTHTDYLYYAGEEKGTYEREEVDSGIQYGSVCFATSDMMISTIGQDPLVLQPERLNENNRWLGWRDFHNAFSWIDLPEDKTRTSRQQARFLYTPDGEHTYMESDEYLEYAEPGDMVGYSYIRSYRYKLVFYSYDENSFNALKAYENMRNNPLAIMGLAPSSFTFTNVKNGIGVCGSYTMEETDWFVIDLK